jgi:ribosome biogenesis GTPase / thiamine phosphate phosphatase
VAKRRLTQHQKRNIHKKQKQHIAVATQLDTPDNTPQQLGRVVANYGNSLIVDDGQKNWIPCTARRHLGSLLAGDTVSWQLSEGTDTPQGVVTAVVDRKSILSRLNGFGQRKDVAANIDQLIIVTAPLPLIQPLLLDQYLVVAEQMGLRIQIILNKTDLLSPDTTIESYLDYYANIGYAVHHTSITTQQGIEELDKILQHNTSIFSGQSGVGKSSLINQLIPDLALRTGQLSELSQLGQHTTSTTTLYPLHGNGYLIDSPGVRNFNTKADSLESISQGFREFRPFLGQCRFHNCQHRTEPGCLIQQEVNAGRIAQHRLQHFHSMTENLR